MLTPLYVMLGIAIFALVLVVSAPKVSKKEQIQVRFTKLQEFTAEEKVDEEKPAWYRNFYNDRELEATQKKLFESGSKMVPEKYLFIKEIVIPFFGFFYGMLMARVYSVPFMNQLLIGAFVGLLGSFFYNNYMMNTRRRQRTTRIEMTLPDFFDMLTTTIEAGLGLSQALTKVCEEIDSPVSEEFQEYLRETRIGSSPREAFENMIERTDSDTFKQVISSIAQASEMGLGLGKSIRSQTEFMRKIQYERMKKKAMQAPVKMSIPLVLFIFPALIIVVIGPAIIQAMSLE